MVGLFLHTVYAFRLKDRGDSKSSPEDSAVAESDASPEEEELWIACRNCQQRLTRPSERTSINGSHRHTFANPSGVVFEICCYRWAQGFALTGPPSNDFTWFSGHNWQIIVCASCHTHLGWHFNSRSSGQFLGFILDRLTEISTFE